MPASPSISSTAACPARTSRTTPRTNCSSRSRPTRPPASGAPQFESTGHTPDAGLSRPGLNTIGQSPSARQGLWPTVWVCLPRSGQRPEHGHRQPDPARRAGPQRRRIRGLLNQLAPLHPRDNTFPGEVFLRMAADALDRFEASRANPVILEGMRERFHRVANPGEYAPGRRTRPRRVLATRLFDEQDGYSVRPAASTTSWNTVVGSLQSTGLQFHAATMRPSRPPASWCHLRTPRSRFA